MKYMILFAFGLVGCGIYKMPTDDFVATNPVVNNPQLTQEKTQPLPGR